MANFALSTMAEKKLKSLTNEVPHTLSNSAAQKGCGKCDLQWNLSILDTIGTEESVRISEISRFQGL